MSETWSVNQKGGKKGNSCESSEEHDYDGSGVELFEGLREKKKDEWENHKLCLIVSNEMMHGIFSFHGQKGW